MARANRLTANAHQSAAMHPSCQRKCTQFGPPAKGTESPGLSVLSDAAAAATSPLSNNPSGSKLNFFRRSLLAEAASAAATATSRRGGHLEVWNKFCPVPRTFLPPPPVEMTWSSSVDELIKGAYAALPQTRIRPPVSGYNNGSFCRRRRCRC